MVQEAADALKAVEAESWPNNRKLQPYKANGKLIFSTPLDKPWYSIKTRLAQHKLTYSKRIESIYNRSKSCRIKYVH